MKKSDERQKKVLDLLNDKKFVTSEEMVSYLQMSTATVRRLLAQMEQQALLRRFHGGVSLRGGYSKLTDTYITFESEKKRIAAHSSLTFIKEGDTIFIGSGTTTGYLKDYLPAFKNLTVITNNLLLLPELLKASHIQLILTGGIVTANIPSMIGAIYPHEYLTKNIAVDSAFLTSECVSEIGASQQGTAELYFEKAFLNLPVQKILMADHSKIGKKRPFIIAPLSQYTCLVTDKDTEGLNLLRHSLPIYLAP